MSLAGVLGFFALLTLMGLSESANVAVTMFFLHLATMVLLLRYAMHFDYIAISTTMSFNLFSLHLPGYWHRCGIFV